MSLSKGEREIKVAILAVSGIGRKSFHKILIKLTELNLGLSDFWRQKPKQIWEVCGLNKAQQAELTRFKKRFSPERYFGWLSKQDIKVVCNEDKEYPNLLKEIDDKPLVLYAKGSLLGVDQRPIGVVGTRRISGYGRSVIGRIIPDLVAQQANIVSGFMYGVDTEVQREVLKCGGYTTGVLGFGFNHCYPNKNRQLFKEIISQGGCFITEYPPWVSGHRGNFPERNRIVAGMSLATVVIEAGKRSGSHITATLAGEYGRGVCAVPGPITNPYSEGTKWLINQGARLISSAEEILEEAGVYGNNFHKIIPDVKELGQLSFADEIQQRIYQELLDHPLSTDKLSKRLGLSISDLNIALSLLELEGYLKKQSDTWFVKKPNSVQ